MPDKSGRKRAAFLVALVLCSGLTAHAGSAVTADDDHSYLPPWMLENASATANGEQPGRQPVVASAVQIAKPEPQEQASSSLSAKASAAKAKVLNYMNKMFGRIGL